MPFSNLIKSLAGGAGAMNPWVGLGLSAGSFLGGLFGNKNQQTQNTNQVTNSNSNTTGTNSFNQFGTNSGITRPVYDPMQGNLRDNLLQQHLQRINGGTGDLLKSTYFSGLRSNNENANRLKNNIAEQYANRGLQYSPASAVAQTGVDNARFGNIVNLESSLPQLAEQIQTQRMQQAGQYLSSLPYAQSNESSSTQGGFSNSNQNTVGNSTTSGQTIQDSSQGGGIGGGIQSLITALAGLIGNGAFGGNKSKGGNAGNAGNYNPGQINPYFTMPSFGSSIPQIGGYKPPFQFKFKGAN